MSPMRFHRETGAIMRRSSIVVLVVMMLATLIIGGSRFATAQDDSIVDHPATGSWLVDSNPGDTEYAPRLMTLSADGSALFVSGHQTTAIGAWEPTGDTTAILTFTVAVNGPGYIVFRASVDAAPDGASFTGTFTDEIVFDPEHDGTSGEIGPGTIDGTRLSAEAPGTPVDTFEDFFAVPGATPGATPAT